MVEELRYKLDGQIKTLESARTRAGIAVSASGVIAGLFAQHLTSSIGNWGLAAIAAFVVSAFPAVWILMPHRMTLSPKAEEWIKFAADHNAFVQGQVALKNPDRAATGDLGAAELASVMVDSMNEWYAKNGPVLNAVHLSVAIAFAGVVVETVCWAGAIAHGSASIWPAYVIVAFVIILTMIAVEWVHHAAPKAPQKADSATTTPG